MVSAILAFGAGFALGAVAGVGGVVLYFQYRTRKQLEAMEEQMGGLMDMEDLQEQD